LNNPPKSKYQIGDFVRDREFRNYCSPIGIIVGVRFIKGWFANGIGGDPYLYSVAWILKKKNNKRPSVYNDNNGFEWGDVELRRYVFPRKRK